MADKVSMEKGKTYLVILKDSDFIQKKAEVVKKLHRVAGHSGLYITFGSSARHVRVELEKRGVVSDIFFIDAVSNKVESRESKTVFVSNPAALTELSILLTDKIMKEKFDFLVFDSVSTMLIYNDVTTAMRFLHYLISKIDYFNITGVVFCLEDEKSQKIIPVLTQLCECKFTI